jgi:hypothetical protein
VTLYKSQPKRGAEIDGIKLTTPTNVKMDVVQLDAATLKKMGFVKLKAGATIGSKKVSDYEPIDAPFKLERSGENDWIVYFSGDMAPAGTVTKINSKNTFTALTSSYSIPIQVWAEGTYGIDPTGRAVPLGSGTTISKPTKITVTVIIR